MRLKVARTLCALVVVSACACGLEKSGLLEPGDGGDPGLIDDGAANDSTTTDAPAPPDGGPGADGAGDDLAVANDAGDAQDARAEASADARADAPIDARPDAPRDARPPLDARDAPSDTADASDAAEASDAPEAPDAHPLPIVWDGGAIADPVFYDNDTAWISFCNHLAGCGDVPSVNGCMSHMPQPFSPDSLIPPPNMISAVNLATSDCQAVAQAIGGGATCASTTADTCSGNSLVTCRLGFVMTVDCGSLGMVCSNGSGNANAGCGFGDCGPPEEGQTFCVGHNYLVQCQNGRYAPKLDCNSFEGASCIGPAGTAECQGTGAACTAGPAGCSGSSMVQCMAGMQGAIDCSMAYDPHGNYGFTCLVDDAGTPVCAAGTACDPATSTDTCSTSTVVGFCNAGVAGTYNCSSYWNFCSGGHCSL